MKRLWNVMFERTIMLWLAATLLVVTAIGIGGMAISVIVAERVQGSGSAINIAGSLRRLSHRMGSIVLSDAENQVTDHYTLREAIVHFEATLEHDALANMLARLPDSPFAATYDQVRETWSRQLKPLLEEQMTSGPWPVAAHNMLLLRIDAFVDRLNLMVAQLEADTEQRIRQLRVILWVALVLTILVLVSGLYAIHRRVLIPLDELLAGASRIAAGDFSARTSHLGSDELGKLGEAFNTMAEAVSRSHGDLERRVAEQTAELTRGNRSLALLYNAIAQLHHAPTQPDTYRAMLGDIDALLELRGSMVCLQSKHGGAATLLAGSLPSCAERSPVGCGDCLSVAQADVGFGSYRDVGDSSLLSLPLRDKDGIYGLMRLALPAGRRLESWQERLLAALTRHVGIALGMSFKAEQERLLALQEERSIIARELHDSIAQALSYMKIQASLLQPMLSDASRGAEAVATLRDLREGISAAYRQLRELLATFRLKMEGDFITLLGATVDEYAARGGMPITLETRLGGIHLTPNQEMHTLQIVREALSNVLRHAHCGQAWVRVIHQGNGAMEARIEDDGIGVSHISHQAPGDTLHYGLSIMRERAQGLHGQIDIMERPEGGTRVLLRFLAESLTDPNPS